MLRLTRAQVREIDRRAMADYHIPGIVLMENAARAVVDTALDMLAGKSGPVLIVAGGGNNGGDGLAVARHLHNRGIPVSIFLAVDPARYTGDALTNWRIVQAMNLPLKWIDDPVLIIDGLFGTGLDKPPRADSAAVIDRINQMGKPVLAIDLPSGLDCDTGMPLGACVCAIRTVTFVAEKTGFANPGARQFTGEIIVGDIGCPRALIDSGTV